MDHHRVLLLVEPVCPRGFLLVQLVRLVSEMFPLLSQVPGHGLAVVVGSRGSQTADDRLGRQGSSFFSGYPFLALVFLRSVVTVNFEGSQLQVMRASY